MERVLKPVWGFSALMVIAVSFFVQGTLNAEPTRWQKVRSESFAKLGDIPKVDLFTRIGAIIITEANPFWVTVKEGYLAAGKELGIQMDVQAAPQENSIAAQLNILENMVAKNYSAIVAHSITRHNLIPGLVKANEKEIATITDSIRVDMKAARDAGADPFDIALVDFFAQGTIGGTYIVEALKRQGGGKVAIIEGLPGAPQSQARKNGAKKVFDQDPSVSLVSVQPGNWNRQKAYDITTNLLQAHPDLKGIMCANDVMALAAVAAIEEKGKKGEVMVVGIDFIAQAKDAILDGSLAGSVAQTPFIIGELCSRAAVKAAAGETIPKELYIPPVLVTGENVNEFADWK
ncbi:MAG: substrate-binding domain-containing protein [Desulfobacter sp.]|nr:substrate-binding domain-containing protein [Desulfobacter sp.]WDP85250.1 MAG: substrate-binding domain-containing protein [Desulfobacter sp.]